MLQKLADKYANKWQDESESYWFARLVEEVGELGASLANDHEHTPDVELRQIATIAMNWLRHFYPSAE
jgi:hypothetical protein